MKLTPEVYSEAIQRAEGDTGFGKASALWVRHGDFHVD
jgi:hypothetical protein